MMIENLAMRSVRTRCLASMALALSMALGGCDGRPLLYQIAPSETDIECLQAYQAIDVNKVGKLTRAEVDTYFQKRFTELDTNHDGFIDEDEAKRMGPIFGMKTASALVFHLDMNGDGHISRDEFLRLSNYLFTRDYDRDGVLTLEEVKMPPTDTAIAASTNKTGVSIAPVTGTQH